MSPTFEAYFQRMFLGRNRVVCHMNCANPSIHKSATGDSLTTNNAANHDILLYGSESLSLAKRAHTILDAQDGRPQGVAPYGAKTTKHSVSLVGGCMLQAVIAEYSSIAGEAGGFVTILTFGDVHSRSRWVGAQASNLGAMKRSSKTVSYLGC
jgi:hypothetical protein